MSLELALAMLRLVLWDFKTDGWPPAPISKGFPRPKMSLELALAMLRLAPPAAAGTLAGFMGFQN